MIITRPKDPAEILSALTGREQVAIVGCGLCATSCNTGGSKEVAAMAALLHDSGKTIVWTSMVDGVCQKMLCARDLKRLPAAPAAVVLACGSGAQTVADVLSIPVVPALDTMYLGSILRVGRFEEKCRQCGSCRLHRFAYLCPTTLCPKGLLNGPCGGMEDGKCETDREKECVWLRIFLAKESSGDLADLDMIEPPRSRLSR